MLESVGLFEIFKSSLQIVHVIAWYSPFHAKVFSSSGVKWTNALFNAHLSDNTFESIWEEAQYDYSDSYICYKLSRFAILMHLNFFLSIQTVWYSWELFSV